MKEEKPDKQGGRVRENKTEREKWWVELSCKQKVTFLFKSLQNTIDGQSEGERRQPAATRRGKMVRVHPGQMAVFKIKSVCRLSCWKQESNICCPERFPHRDLSGSAGKCPHVYQKSFPHASGYIFSFWKKFCYQEKSAMCHKHQWPVI